MTGLEFLRLTEEEIKKYIESLPDRGTEIDFGIEKRLLGLRRVSCGYRKRKVIKFPVRAELIGSASTNNYTDFTYQFKVNGKILLEIYYSNDLEKRKRIVHRIYKY